MRVNQQATTENKQEAVSVRNETIKVANPICDNFICFIRQREVCMSSAELMIHSLNAFKLLVHSGEYEKRLGIAKVMELIMSTYQTDDYSRMIDDFWLAITRKRDV